MKAILIVTSLLLALNIYAQTNSTSKINKKLCEAITEGDTEAVETALTAGALPDISGTCGKPLLIAVRKGHTEITRLLLSHGADPDQRTAPFQETPITVACSLGYFDIAYLLARYGANIDQKDIERLTPLHYSVNYGNYTAVDMLLSYGAKANVKSPEGDSPLHIAMYLNDTAIASLLLNYGADINSINYAGNTPYMTAAYVGNLEALKMLDWCNANPNLSNYFGYSALSLAMINQHEEIVSYLLHKTKPDTNCTSHIGYPGRIVLTYSREHIRRIRKQGYEIPPPFQSRQMTIEAGASFNADDLLFRARHLTRENRSYIAIGFGFTTRIYSKGIRITNEQGKSEMFYGNRLAGDLYLEKQFIMFPSNNRSHRYGAYLGMNLQYGFHDFTNTSNHAKDHLYYIPYAGLSLIGEYMQVRLGYSYVNYDYPYVEFPGQRIELMFGLSINDEWEESHAAYYYPSWF